MPFTNELIVTKEMLVRKITYMVALVCTYTLAYSASTLSQVEPTQEQISWVDRVTGPFGALFLSLVGLWIAYKIIWALQQKNQNYVAQIEQLHRELIADKDRQIEELKRKLDK